MRRFFRSWVAFLMIVGTVSYAVAQEQIVLTTFYPSPKGVYDELRTSGNVHIGSLAIPNALLQVTPEAATDPAIMFQVNSFHPTLGAGAVDPFIIGRDAGQVAIRRTAIRSGTPAYSNTFEISGDASVNNGDVEFSLSTSAGQRFFRIRNNPTTQTAVFDFSPGLAGDAGPGTDSIFNIPCNPILLRNADPANTYVDNWGIRNDNRTFAQFLPCGYMPGYTQYGEIAARRLAAGTWGQAAKFSVRNVYNNILTVLVEDNDAPIDPLVADPTPPFAITNAGIVGIGTRTPTVGLLHIVRDSLIPTPHLRITNLRANDYARIQLDSGQAPFWHIAGTAPGAAASAYLNFYYSDVVGNVISIVPTAPQPSTMILQGGNIIFVASAASPDDSGDVIFRTNAGVQKARIWSDPAVASSRLFFSAGDNNNSPDLVINSDGNVGVFPNGAQPYNFPSAFNVRGDISISGVYRCSVGVDVSENIAWVHDQERSPEPGDVVVIASGEDESVALTSKPYDTAVAGVVATKPGVWLGDELEGAPIALVGRIPTKVTVENGPIRRGDILVTSSKPGYAMKADPDKVESGMVIGKAMGELEEGDGTVVVLVNLQ